MRWPATGAHGPVAAAAVFAVAVVARLLPIVRGHGLFGTFNYDASVYYAAADALVHGRVPYRDFLFVHPPLVAVVYAPFAWFGDLTSDHLGFAAATVATVVIGGVNAVLVLVLARRWGVPLFAGVAGALFYACWYGSVQAESLIRLEPLGNLLLLLALLTLSGPRSTRRALAAGILLGLLASVKIWWLAPIAVIWIWQAVTARSARWIAAITAGGVAAVLAVDGPFLALAGHRMVDMVITSQLGRQRRPGERRRLSQLLGTFPSAQHLQFGVAAAFATVAVLAAVGLAALLAVRTPAVRLAVALSVVQVLVLEWSPSTYAYYADYVAVPFALVVAGGVGRLAAGGWRLRAGAVLPAAGAAGLTLAIVFGFGVVGSGAFPRRAAMARQAATVRCITSDTPMLLVLLDALDRSFAPGCPNRVDVMSPATVGTRGRAERVTPGVFNPRWAADMTTYLLSGNGVIVSGEGLGIGHDDLKLVEGGPLIATNGRYSLHRAPG